MNENFFEVACIVTKIRKKVKKNKERQLWFSLPSIEENIIRFIEKNQSEVQRQYFILLLIRGRS
jgi:hypothetical protein